MELTEKTSRDQKQREHLNIETTRREAMFKRTAAITHPIIVRTSVLLWVILLYSLSFLTLIHVQNAAMTTKVTRDEIGPATRTKIVHGDNFSIIDHITVEVSNLTLSEDWYKRALPIRKVERKIRTAVNGAWFQITCCYDGGNKDCCCSSLALCSTQVHLMEKKFPENSFDKGGLVTGQHIGLDLGTVTLDIRDVLYGRGIAVTLAPQNGNKSTIFVTDPDKSTWEFTHAVVQDKQSVSKVFNNPENQLSKQTATTKTDKSVPMNSPRPSAADTRHFVKNQPFKFAIATGNPLATAAGHAILQAGGSAADATIAAAAVMSVVEPYNGGLGGDFMAILHKSSRGVMVLNGTGRSPKTNLTQSKVIPQQRGLHSALTVPGAPAAWCRLHADSGRFPWQVVLAPAISLASEGFKVSQRTAQVWQQGVLDVISSGKVRGNFLEEFLSMYAPLSSRRERLTPRAGERFYNPALASSLSLLAKHGCKWFYEEAVPNIFTHLGYDDKDEKAWKENPVDHATWERAISTNFTLKGSKDQYIVYSVGGNSQGATANLILNVLQESLSENSTEEEVIHHHINAKRAVYRNYFRQAIPEEVLTSSDFAESLASEILEAFHDRKMVDSPSVKEKSHNTEGFVVRDSGGLTIAALQSLALPFGSGLVIPSLGFAVQGRGYGFSVGEKDEFSFMSHKRPWTTLSPYLVQRNGQFWMAAAVKGGDRQPYAFTQIFLNLVLRKSTPAVAVALPRFRDSSHHGFQVVQWDQPLHTGVSDLFKHNLTGLAQVFHTLGEQRGCKGIVFNPSTIEDSGFGVAQLLLEDSGVDYADPASLALNTQLVAVSDLSRKPGLAIVGSQSRMIMTSLVAAEEMLGAVDTRDFRVIAQPLRHFMSSHLKPLTESELVDLSLEGSVQERDRRFETSRVRLAVQNSGMWAALFNPSQRVRVFKEMNVDLVRMKHDKMWNFPDLSAIVPSTICTDFVFDEVAQGSAVFPVGVLPAIRPDRFIVSLSEDNPRFYILLKSFPFANNVPAMIDSRERKWSNLFDSLRLLNAVARRSSMQNRIALLKI
jgi:gamma-glutamyltranspeptidase/glutathione hydrolase